MTQAKRDFPSLIESVERFRENSYVLNDEYTRLHGINSPDSFIWDLLKLPKVLKSYFILSSETSFR